jgi:hypothetical protein
LGVTNPNGKILLASRLIDSIEDNFWVASVIIHERKHFSNLRLGMYQGNNYISNEMDELSAYLEAASWTGAIEKEGFTHLRPCQCLIHRKIIKSQSSKPIAIGHSFMLRHFPGKQNLLNIPFGILNPKEQ